jgi:metallopeptidase MepB
MSLRTPPQLPPSFRYTPESLLTETTTILNASIQLRDRLVISLSPATATFATVLVPLIDDHNLAACHLNIFRLLGSVSPSPELRDASRKAEKLIESAEARNLIRADIAALVRAVVEKHEDLDVESAHLLSRKQYEYKHAGIENERYLAAKAELNDALSAARKTLTEAKDGLLLSREDLAGVPATTLASMREEDGGKLWVTFGKSHYGPVMRYASEETRQRLWTAKQNRFPANVERLQRIVVLRDEIARILGFENHAALRIEERMATSVDRVKDSLEELRAKTWPFFEAERDRLSRLKRETCLENAGLYVWDWNFYDQRLRESFLVKGEAVEYFEAEKTLQGMLEIMAELFGIQFEVIQAETWHPDVQVYATWDDGDGGDGGFLGYLYVDIFARLGKFDGARHSVVTPGFVDGNETRYHPSSALICSVTKSSRTTLLSHNETRTMFHELGHAIHYLTARTKYALKMSKDFVEIPSLMLEYWIWVPEVLKRLGKHYLDGSAMPDQLITDMVGGKNVNEAHKMLSSVQLALFDLVIHTPVTHEEAQAMDLTRLWNETKRDIVGLPGYSGIGQAGFPHIYRTYDAGYFAYPL